MLYLGRIVLLFFVVCAWGGLSPAAAAKDAKAHSKTAIVVAHFGTTVVSALPAVTTVMDEVHKAYPDTEVRLTFTSNIIRSVWKKRRANASDWLSQGVPEEILYVKNLIQTLGDLQEEGFTDIIVQPSHMFFMEQSQDLEAYIAAFNSIDTMKSRWRPFNKVVMGRPALGMPGEAHSYHEDVLTAVQTLAGDAKMAIDKGAALVYMGHGNEHWSTGIYAETQKALRTAYPEVKTYIGVVEGNPTLDDVIEALKRDKITKVLVKPLMISAGDHANNDMAGEEKDSWKSILTAEGFVVETVLAGLGENKAFADIFVKHIRDAADDNGIALP